MSFETSNLQNNRLQYVDWAKTIGIFLVIWGHTYPIAYYGLSPIRLWIYAFHMPLFFFISGLLHRHVGIRAQLRKCLRGLIIPSLIWVALYLVIFAVRDFATLPWKTALYKNLHEIVHTLCSMLRGHWFICGVVWYCFVLAECKCISELIAKLKRRWKIVLTALYIVLFLIILHYPQPTRVLFIAPAIVALPYFYMGLAVSTTLNKHMTAAEKLSENNILILATCAACAMATVAYLIMPHGYSDIFSCSFGHELPCLMNIFSTYGLAVLGIIGTLLISRCLASFPISFCSKISSATLVLLCIHPCIESAFLPHIINKYIPLYNDMSLLGFISHASVACAIIIVGMAVCRIARKLGIGAYLGCR